MAIEASGMDEGLKLRIKGHLFELREVNDEVIGSRQGHIPTAEDAYTKTLESVANQSNHELVDEVAESIKNHIRTQEERPPNQSVRKDARSLLVDEGYLPDDYLNRA